MIHINISHLDYPKAIEKLQNILHQNTNDIFECHLDFSADHTKSKIIRDFIGTIFDFYNIHHPWR